MPVARAAAGVSRELWHPGENTRNRSSTVKSPQPWQTKLTQGCLRRHRAAPPRVEEAGELPSMSSTGGSL